MAGPAEDTGDWANVQAGIDFIRSWKAGDPPYVLFLPLLFPHCPYTAPEPYYSMYGEADVVPLLPHGQGKADYMGLIRRYRQLDDPSALRQAQALYGDGFLHRHAAGPGDGLSLIHISLEPMAVPGRGKSR